MVDVSPTRSNLLAALGIILIVAGIAAFVVGEFLVAGLCFFGLSLTIYVREKES